MLNQREEIKRYISRSLPNRELTESLSGTIEKVISHILQQDEKQVNSLYQHYKRETEAENQPVKTTFDALPSLLNFNLVSVQYNKDQNRVEPVYRWANRFNKDACNYVYVAQIDGKFYPINEQAVSVSINDVFALIANKDSDSQSLVNLLSQIPQAHLITLCDLPQPLSVTPKSKMTVIYYMCLLGRFDLLKAFQSFPITIFEGVHEESIKNTPLHIASFEGHVNIVAVLLFRGAKPALNAQKQHPSQFNPRRVPPRHRNTLTRIWNTYKEGTFMKEFANWKPVKEEVINNPSGTIGVINTDAVISTMGPVTVEQLCTFLDDDNQPPLPEFQRLFEPGRFDIKHINNPSPLHKCTAFYIACKKGHFELVEYLIENNKKPTTDPDKKIHALKITGAQESFTGKGNTPLHVANWRGHTRIVAFLLYTFKRATPLEPKADSGPKPNHHTERNPGLPMHVRTDLQTIFNLHERGKFEELRKFFEKDSSTPSNEISADNTPLWFEASVPNKVPGPEYGKLSHLWYYRETNQKETDPLILLDIIKSSYLCYIYLKYRKNPSTTTFDAKIPIMPAGGIFASLFGPRTVNWSYEINQVDFAKATITFNRKTYKLVPIARPKTWYYSTTRDVDQGPYLAFPHQTNEVLNGRLTAGTPISQFPLSKRGIFRPPQCTANVVAKTVDIGGYSYKMIIEDEHSKRSYWEPDFYSPRNIEDPFLRWVVDPKEDKYREEYNLITNYFSLSMGPNCTIIKVSKIHSHKIAEEFEEELKKVQTMITDDSFRSAIKYTSLLWYGPGVQNVREINADGLKPNNLRIWNRGYYFSSEASFAANWAYTDRAGIKILVLAKVLTGNAIYLDENTTIDHYPTEFNSIYTYKNGSWVNYVVNKAAVYPVYLVEFREH